MNIERIMMIKKYMYTYVNKITSCEWMTWSVCGCGHSISITVTEIIYFFLNIIVQVH